MPDATMKAWLLERIPSMARYRDEQFQQGMLDELIEMLAHGLGLVKTDIDSFPDIIDTDDCPAAFLPELAKMLGFEFPYDLPEAQQRAFIRNSVALYRVKGRPITLQFVTTRLMGSKDFQIQITAEDWQTKTFTVQLVSTEESNLTADLTSKVVYLVDLYTPAGLVPTVLLSAVYSDDMDPALWTVDDQYDALFEKRYTSLNIGHQRISSTTNTAKLNKQVVVPIWTSDGIANSLLTE